jgi:uncharacterized protein (DUF924 family)
VTAAVKGLGEFGRQVTPREVLDFWFQGEPEVWRVGWFRVDPAFDDTIRTRFGAAAAAARDGGFADWAATPEGALALALLLDQFPRNLHRGTAAAFASDARGLSLAREAVLRRRFDLALPAVQRVFLYLPFEHQEAMAEQNISVALFEGLRDEPARRAPGGSIDYAWRHYAVIRRFGRYPHRNAALGRASTAAEQHYLAQPGAGF